MQLPVLRPDQWKIATHPAKVKVLSMGRRWGKTVLGRVIVGATLAQGGRVAWVTPSYKNSRPLWRGILSACADDIKAKRMTVNKSDRTIEAVNGGWLGLYSGENIDAIRGESLHLAVLDEAARLPEDAWSDAILPTLADYDGDALLISTPFGKNWFWLEFQRMYDDDNYMSWTAPSSDNPNPNIKRAAELARQRVPDAKYKQEWLAEFVDDGLVFTGLREAATAKQQGYAQDGHPSHPAHNYVVGVDWGQMEDFSVFTVVDTTIGEQCYIDRSRHIEYLAQIERLKELCKRFGVREVVAESNAQATTMELIRRSGLPLREVHTTNENKADMINALKLGIESKKLKILNDPVLIGEMQAFQATRTSTGKLRYGAPAGWHDDCVMALALAWDGAKDNEPMRIVRPRR